MLNLGMVFTSDLQIPIIFIYIKIIFMQKIQNYLENKKLAVAVAAVATAIGIVGIKVLNSDNRGSCNSYSIFSKDFGCKYLKSPFN